MGRRKTQSWVPLWVDAWLFGTTRIELTPAERAIWVDFLALGAKHDGYIRAGEGIPYPLKQLAGMLLVEEETLQTAIEKFIQFGKIERLEDGTMRIVNWDKYQLTDRYRREIERGTKTEQGSEKAEPTSEKTEQGSEKAEPIEDKRREYNIERRRTEEDIVVDPVQLAKIERYDTWTRIALEKGIDPLIVDYVIWRNSKEKLRSPLQYAKKIQKEGFDPDEARADGWVPFQETNRRIAEHVAEHVRKEYERVAQEAAEAGYDIETIKNELPADIAKEIAVQVADWGNLYGVSKEIRRKEARIRAWRYVKTYKTTTGGNGDEDNIPHVHRAEKGPGQDEN